MPRARSDKSVRASQAPLMTHLLELRRRLLWCLGFWVALSGAAFVFAERIFSALLWPYQTAAARLLGEGSLDLQMIYTAPHEYFFVQMKLALFAGFGLAFPLLAFQLYRFVAPGLYRSERRAFLPFLFASPILFAAGAALVFFIIMPLALEFFLAMGHESANGIRVQMMARVSEYLSFTMVLMLAFGLCFQLPVVVVLLARAGLVRAEQLRRARKYVAVGVFVLAAVLTPPDVISQLGLALPTLILYEGSVWLAHLLQPRLNSPKKRRAHA